MLQSELHHPPDALSRAAVKGHAECSRLLISNPKARRSAALQEAIDYANADCDKLLAPVSEPL